MKNVFESSNSIMRLIEGGYYVNFAFVISSLFIGMVLIISFYFEHKEKENKSDINFKHIVYNMELSFILDAICYITFKNPKYIDCYRFCYYGSYVFIAVMGLCFTKYLISIIEEKKLVPIAVKYAYYGLFITYIIFCILMGLSNKIFNISDNYVFRIDEWYYVMSMFELVFMLAYFLIIFIYRNEVVRKYSILFSAFIFIPTFISMKVKYFVTLEDISYALAVTLVYISIFKERSKKVIQQEKELAERREQLAVNQLELNEAHLDLMISQIQPHFLYNTLNSIAYLCLTDGAKAYNTVITFSTYLRNNMSTVFNNKMVYFDKELENIKIYLEIEKLRFSDKLNIFYDIKVSDFMIPPLSVQPLVENAVKHGVSQKICGGNVWIITEETERYYEIIIEDDGVGFDINLLENPNEYSIGINNIKKRIEYLCDGQIVINSEIGKGTIVEMYIPRKSNSF